MDALWFALTLALMIVGLVGTFVPMLPGIPLIYGALLLYGLLTGWQAYGLTAMLVWGMVTFLVLLFDFMAGSLGAKRYGASRAGFWGSVAGGIIGAVAGGLPGLIVGPFVGAVAGEMIAGRSGREALRSGWGTFVGFVAGSLVKIAVGLAMAGTFIWWTAF